MTVKSRAPELRSMKALKLTLYAPEQYYAKGCAVPYGTMSTLYPTETHPTKRALCGMLGCALGYPRFDPRLQELYDSCKMYWVTVSGDRHIITDYQTCSPLRPGDKFTKVGKNSSKEAKTLIKLVEYIVDTEFAVYVEADEKLLKELHYALNWPCWEYYLGKRKCTPVKQVVPINFELEDIPNEAVECF